jgi:hypothetical protein
MVMACHVYDEMGTRGVHDMTNERNSVNLVGPDCRLTRKGPFHQLRLSHEAFGSSERKVSI